MKSIVTNSLEETVNLAKKMGEASKPGDVFALIGDLGAGKTAFSKGFAKGLNIQSTVNSPTFTILNIYEDGRLPMYHFDAYRIEEPSEMEEIGFEEYIYGDGVCVIEWADIIEDILPLKYVLVKIEIIDKNKRRVLIEEKDG